jgi:hypothetical protein
MCNAGAGVRRAALLYVVVSCVRMRDASVVWIVSSRCIVPLPAHFCCLSVHICSFSYTRLSRFLSRSRLSRSRSRFRWKNTGRDTVKGFSVRFRPFSSLTTFPFEQPWMHLPSSWVVVVVSRYHYSTHQNHLGSCMSVPPSEIIELPLSTHS